MSGLPRPHYPWNEGDELFAQELNAAIGSGGTSMVSVISFGAQGDGVTDDTVAIQKAATSVAARGGAVFFPAGTYIVSAAIKLASNTRAMGVGPSSILRPAVLAAWAGAPYVVFTGLHDGQIPAVDQNILIDSLQFTFVDLQSVPGGGNHAVYFTSANNITVRDCVFYYGNDAVAFRGCANTLILGCSAFAGTNCAYDHWSIANQAPSNARVIGCYAETANAGYQMVNFNASSGAGGPSGMVADGCVIANNEFIYKGTTQGIPILLDPLGVGNTVKNVVVANNRIKGLCCIFGRGNCQNVSVANNVMDVVGLTNCAIAFYQDSADMPSTISVTGNVIIGAATVAGNVSVIRVAANGFLINANTTTGGAYVTACSGTGSGGVIGSNNFAPGTGQAVIAPTASSGTGEARMLNGQAYAWFDAAGHLARMYIQTDNNLVLYGTDNTGAPKLVFAQQQNAAGGVFTIASGLQAGSASVNSMQLLGNSSASPVRMLALGTDANVGIQLIAKGNLGVVASGQVRGGRRPRRISRRVRGRCGGIRWEGPRGCISITPGRCSRWR